MQFVPESKHCCAIFCLNSTNASGAGSFPSVFDKSLYKTAESHQNDPRGLQVRTHLAAQKGERSAVLHGLTHTKSNNRNYPRNPGLHSPAHLMQNYSAPIARRLCRAVQTGSGLAFNLQNQYGIRIGII
jgi:hypothetical protein